MITVEMIAMVHPEYGTWGLARKGYERMEPFAGRTVAHDLLEHFPDDKGDTEGELEALGAMIYVRGAGLYAHQKGQTVDEGYAIAHEIPEQCRYREQADKWSRLAKPPRTRKAEGYVEDILDRAWVKATQLCLSEFEDVTQQRKRDMTYWLTFRDDFIGWLRSGYRKAQRRYQRYSPEHMVDMFIEIESCADRVLRYVKEVLGPASCTNQARMHIKLHYDLRRRSCVYEAPDDE